jgi:hypothetical protein
MRLHFISIPRALPEQPVAPGGVRGALRPLLAAQRDGAPTRTKSMRTKYKHNPKSNFDAQEETWNHLLM